MCNCSCPGNARLMILTNANFDFDKFLKIPPASITALADGWLVDLDLVYIQTHGVPCFIKYTHTDGSQSRIDAVFFDPQYAGSVISV